MGSTAAWRYVCGMPGEAHRGRAHRRGVHGGAGTEGRDCAPCRGETDKYDGARRGSPERSSPGALAEIVP